MSQRIKEYHRWLVQMARAGWQSDTKKYEEICKDPLRSELEKESAKQMMESAWEIYVFAELADFENYAAHKRDKKTRKEQGL